MRNCLLSIFTILSFTVSAQYYSYPFKIQIGAGTSSYFGDLCEGIDCSTYGYNLAINTRSIYTEHFSVYTHLNFFRLSSEDAENEVRNLSFRSDNIAFAIGGYYMFTKYRVKSQYQSKINPYVGVGLGGVFFNPKTLYENEWHSLHGLNTEGQYYGKFAWQIPLHIGLRFRVTDWVAIGFEYSYYFTFTDYLDDVSGNYVANETLLGLSADLADRTFEGENIPTATEDGIHWVGGAKRGNDRQFDYYHSFLFYVEIDLNRKNVVMFH
ncbi:MAG: outer membrane beta-barrel protein [Cytophagales bacterium]|nr:outer membrane beta-barrel protein [Cytophagales bacterium]